MVFTPPALTGSLDLADHAHAALKVEWRETKHSSMRDHLSRRFPLYQLCHDLLPLRLDGNLNDTLLAIEALAEKQLLKLQCEVKEGRSHYRLYHRDMVSLDVRKLWDLEQLPSLGVDPYFGEVNLELLFDWNVFEEQFLDVKFYFGTQHSSTPSIQQIRLHNVNFFECEFHFL